MVNIVAMRLFKNIYVALAISLLACNTRNDQSYTVIQAGDSIQFIKIADATSFLSGWKTTNTLVYQMLQEPDNLHPTNGKTLMRGEVFMYTQFFLINTDFYTNELRPSLLKKMPEWNEKDSTYSFEIRDEPRWDNGDPLTAEDVIFSLKACKLPLTQNEFFKPYLENFSEIKSIPGSPGRFELKVIKPYILDVAIWSDIVIMQRKFHDPENVLGNYSLTALCSKEFEKKMPDAVQKWSVIFNAEPSGFEPAKLNGLGAYKVIDWQHGQYLILEKKQKHWALQSANPFETAYSEKIILRFSADHNANILEFKKQNFDASSTLSTKSLFALQQDSNFNKNYNSRFCNTFNYSYAAFNMKPDGKKHKKLFDDLLVRQAFSMLVPYDQINQVVYMNQYKRQEGPVCRYKNSFNKTLQASTYDLNAAITILNKAGWTDTDKDGILDKMTDGQKINFEFDLNIYAGIPDWQDFALLMASEFKKAGIVAHVVSLDVSTLMEKARSHDFDMFLSVWTTAAGPEDYSQIWHSSSWNSYGDNYSGFGDATSDALIDSIKFTLNDSARIKLEWRLQQMIVDAHPYLFMFNSQRRVALHKRFGNCEIFFEKPGLLLNNLKLLQTTQSSASSTP
jgi:ABC-type transport system substrate-binding protein